jgi:hypothetical protein
MKKREGNEKIKGRANEKKKKKEKKVGEIRS